MKKKTEGEFSHRFGKMIKGIHSFLLKEDELSDTQNMQPGFYWRQRKGQTALTAAAVASGLRFKSLTQFSKLDESEDMLLAHVYDSVNGERIMSGSALPPSAITWSARDTLSASCKLTQFAYVKDAVILANNKEFLIWRGTSHKPTGVWKYINSASAYINYFDEATDSKSTTYVVLDSLGTSDKVVVVSEMPLTSITPTIADQNISPADLTVKYFNGSFTAVSGLSDGTSDSVDALISDNFGDNSLNELWTTEAGSGGSTAEQNQRLEVTSGLGYFNGTTNTPTGAFQNGAAGDFEIRVKLSNLGAISTDYESVCIDIRVDTDGTNSGWKLSRAWNSGAGGDSVMWYHYTNGAESYTRVASTDSTVWFKIVRTSGVVTAYWTTTDIDTDWVQISQPGTAFDSDLTFDIGLTAAHNGGGTEFTAYFDDFTVDTTPSVDKSLYQAGTISWTLPSDEVPTITEAIPGYAYELSWDAALSLDVNLSAVDVFSPMGEVQNIWDGMPVICTGCKVYDGTKHIDATAYVNNDNQGQYADLSAATTSYKFYVGFAQPVSRVNLWVSDGYVNDNNVSITAIKYHKNDGAWTSVGAVTDTTETGTETLSQEGYWEWTSPELTRYTEKPVTVGGDSIPWFWYEVTFDATLGDTVYVYRVNGVPVLEEPDLSYGCFAYKGRAWQLAPLNAENAARHSAFNLPNVWSGRDSGYMYFGERPLRRAVPFYNEMVVWCDREMWMLQGNSPANFGKLKLSSNIGIAAPLTAVSIEAGVVVGSHRKVVLMWMTFDGLYMFDGVKWFKVSSPDIDNFFDPEHADYINSSYIDQCYAEYDYETQCYICTIYSGSGQTTPNKVIALHVPTMSYGIYEYGVEISSFLNVINGRHYLVAGGDACGKFYRHNNGSQDLNSSGVATAIDAYIVTRDMFHSYSDGLQERLFSLMTEANEGGMIELDTYPDASDTPQSSGKGFLARLGKSIAQFQWNLKLWNKSKTVKFRIRNRSLNKRMNLLGHSTTFDRGRSEE